MRYSLAFCGSIMTLSACFDASVGQTSGNASGHTTDPDSATVGTATNGGDGGGSCASNDECASGHCVDGACCDTTCDGPCERCDLTGSRGTCLPVPEGEDPKSACPPGTGSSLACKPGHCNGAGECAIAASGTACREGSCAEGKQTDEAFCDADGDCPELTTTECGPYTCAGSTCNTACAALGACVMGSYCEETSASCRPQKAVGIGCSNTVECLPGLVCQDGVCCSEAACPECTNCGADGECTIGVTRAPDPTGLACVDANVCDPDGVCLLELGQECGVMEACASGNCVDDVCCDQAECGTCLDCDASGSCSVIVTNADDVTGSCRGASTCDDTGDCVPRWELVGSVAEDQPPAGEYSGVVGDVLYFAAGNGGSYFKAFDTVNNLFSDVTLTNADYCWCGYTGITVSDGTSLFYFGNDGVMLTPGDVQWTPIASYSGAVPDGENATTQLGGKIYRIGGRGYSKRTSVYNIMGDSWDLTPAEAPVDGDQRCAGSSGTNVYLFGNPGGAIHRYATVGDTWTTLPNDPNQPGCSLQELHLWQGRLVNADNGGVRKFRVATESWEADTIPPPQSGLDGPRAMVANDTLFLVALDRIAGKVNVWKYLLDPS